MSTGSPTSTLSLNRMPLVVRPSFTSRQTMMRFSSIRSRSVRAAVQRSVPRQGNWRGASSPGARTSPGGTGRQQDCRARRRRGTDPAVLGLRCDHRRVRGLGIIGVNEVEGRVLRDAGKDRVLPGEVHRVPSHVRHLQPVRRKRSGARRPGTSPRQSCPAPPSGRR